MSEPAHPPTLPHAPPMHWLDSATLSSEGRTTTATRRITPAHLFVEAGHLLPSALIELLAQTAAAGAILRAAHTRTPAPVRGVLAAIHHFHVHTAVPAPSTLTLTATLQLTRGPLTRCDLAAHLDETLIAEAEMTFHLTPDSAVRVE